MIINSKIYFSVLLILGGFLTSCSPGNQSSSPNIVLIVADDLGWNDVGFHGSQILTPNLDRLADEGIELTRFYTTPICSPTRAGLLTGKYPDRFNLRKSVFSPVMKGGIPVDEVTLPEMLEEAGYKHRAAFGKWHLGHSDYKYHPNSQGFSYFYGHYNGAIDYYTHLRDGERDWHRNNEPCNDEGYSTDLIGQEVVDFIQNSKDDSPFFAYVAFNAPHSPMQARQEELAIYGYNPNEEAEDYPVVEGHNGERGMETYGTIGRGNSMKQTYSAMVTRMDYWIGNILRTIKEIGAENNTIVWFLSDNGGIYEFGGNNQPLRGGKHSYWEGGVRTVSVVKWPGMVTPGSKSEELIAYIDIFPTIEKIVTQNNQYLKDGIDVAPALKGSYLPHRYLFLGENAIVTKKWKMNGKELFAIENDISEKNNLYNEFPEVVRELNDEINAFSKMTPGKTLERQKTGWLPPKNWTMPGEDDFNEQTKNNSEF